MNFWQQASRGNVKGTKLNKEELRKKLNIVYIGDQSGSMAEETCIYSEDGEATYVPKIEQAVQGIRQSFGSLRRFERENTSYQVLAEYIPLNTYCKPLYPTFKELNELSQDMAEVEFTASGVTNIRAVFQALKSLITTKHLGEHYNRPLIVIMFSDGLPTDENGYLLSETEWKKAVNDLKSYLIEHDLARSVELYFIAIGDDAEPFGRYFAGDEHFFKVEESESIADKIDFATRQSLADITSVPTDVTEEYELDEEDEDDYEYDEDEDSTITYDLDEDEDTVDEETEQDVTEDEDDDDDDDGDGDGSLDDILKF